MDKQVIKINCSKLAALVCLNPYESPFQAYSKLFSRKKDLIAQLGNVIEPTEEEKLYSFNRKYKIFFKMEIFKKCSNIEELNKAEEDVFMKFRNKMPSTRQIEFKTLLNQVLRKRFGSRKEESVRKAVNIGRKDKIVKSNKYFCKTFFETKKFIFKLGGYLDGTDTSGTIYEIKTRRNRLFHTLRDYEKVQMYCYMFLKGCSRACLIEQFYKNAEEVERDQQEIEFENEFWSKIKTRAELACNIFEDCFESEHEKHILAQTEEGRRHLDSEIKDIVSRVAEIC